MTNFGLLRPHLFRLSGLTMLKHNRYSRDALKEGEQTVSFGPTNNLIKRLSAGLLAVTFLILPATTIAASLDEQIQALKVQLAQQQSQASQLQGVANDYQSRVNQLNAQIAYLQTQIALSQAQYNRLSGQIAENQAKLETAKSQLAAALKSMYITGNQSSLEILMSSDSLNQYFDKQQYKQAVQDKVKSAIDDINTIQDRLKDQQAQVGAIISSQNSQKQQLQASRVEAAQLLALAQGNVAAANQQVKSTSSDLKKKQTEQAAILAAASSSGGSMGGSGGACDNGHGNGGYPSGWCNAAQDSIQTPSGLNRECVSWAGFRWHQFGNPTVNWGNANTWDDGARAAGRTVNNSPSVGAIAQTDAGPFGHVAVVEAVSGGTVTVSEMNYDSAGHFRLGNYSASYFRYIH
jgi:surface antigen